ncbi:MAG: hypothetical protein C5S40_07440 [ANME-2 cluster archaeon]|nr:hypothetical protein [ANME-2 cluster archaeon]
MRFKACINLQGWLLPAVQEELRRCARICSTHYSTHIEGNRLTLEEARQVIEGTRTSFHARERDVGEDDQIEPEALRRLNPRGQAEVGRHCFQTYCHRKE